MGVGLSAQGVSMNRLPGNFMDPNTIICLFICMKYIYLHTNGVYKFQVGINIHMVIMAMMAIHFAQVAQVNHTGLLLPLAILLVVE